jgi:osmotically-inducible protein OsmY
VAVSDRHGTVTLRGSVGSLHQRRAIVKIARSVPGVVNVEDELRVGGVNNEIKVITAGIDG